MGSFNQISVHLGLYFISKQSCLKTELMRHKICMSQSCVKNLPQQQEQVACCITYYGFKQKLLHLTAFLVFVNGMLGDEVSIKSGNISFFLCNLFLGA